MNNPFLKIEALAKVFPSMRGGEPLTVFENIHFQIAKGEFVCIIGHSGCGKSSILNVLAGLDEATSGTVIMDEREVSGPSLDRGVVFQSHALMPWLTVMENIVFAVKSRWPEYTRDQWKGQAQKYIDLVHLTGANNAFVTTFKGDCTHCHKLETKTGGWSMPSGPEQ